MSSISEIRAARGVAPPVLAALVLTAVAAAAILAAFGFQYLGGYEPCPLCLQERWAYYFAIPAAFAAAVLLRGRQANGALVLLVLCALAFALNAGLGLYHSGIEWQWWPGPVSCSGGGLSIEGGNVIDAIRKETVVRCDEAPWRFLGLSFAGYNALISAGLAALALWGAARGGEDGRAA